MRTVSLLLVATVFVMSATVGPTNGARLAASAQAPASAPVTFNRDIAPIVFSHCISCHRPGEIGPFSLLTYRDARQHATQIASVTARRLMPPWKPVHGSNAFIGDRSLADADIALVQRWVTEGAKEGRAEDLPKVPPGPDRSSPWQLGTPDLVITMPDPYDVPAASPGGDLFRTFVIPIPMTTAKFVRALEFHPGNARVVHHANLGVDRTGSSRRLDALDPAPGYAGGMVPDASYPAGYMLGWTPGQTPRPSPDGMPWRLEAGSDLVVQVHLQPTGKPEPLQLSAGLFFTDEPPVRLPVGLRLGSQTIDIPAGASDYAVTDTYVLPVDAELLAVQPHAHNLARTIEASVTRPDGSTQSIIRIADWNFRWQDVYRYVTPLTLPKGATVSMRIVYDNSARNPRSLSPPRRVVWGPNTSDEMGDLWLQLVTRADADRLVLDADVTRKTAADDLAAYTKLLQAEPRNPLRHDTVAMLYLKSGRLDEAIAEFRASLQLNQESAPTHYNLGLALSMQQKLTPAMIAFSDALRIDPGYAEAHNNLAGMLLINGQAAEAVDHYRRVVALQPGSAQAHDNLARGLAALGRAAEALDEFRMASSLRPEWPAPLAGAAWIHATTSDASLRDPAEAIRQAERAADLSGRRDAIVLDTLAAAYAAGGRFPDAIVTADAALQIAIGARSTALAEQIRGRRAQYQRGEPFREGQGGR